VPLAPYRRVLSIPAARKAILLGIMVRIPIFAGGVVLTLHVVQTLGLSYGRAGFVAAGATLCIAVSGPWRGRLLDRLGLRRVVLPSIVVNAACWSIAPFVGYWPLFALAALTGLFVVPTFSIIRQAVITAVPEQERRTALSLDAVAVELSFMVGPLIGVWAITIWSTSWVLFTIGMVDAAAGAAIWISNPRLNSEASQHEDAPKIARRSWFGPRFLAICAAAVASTIVLSGCDIAIVAALRHFDQVSVIGPVLAIWGLGSIVGGLVYGVLHRPIPAYVMLAGLSLVTIPCAYAGSAWPLTGLVFLAGVLCAPTITATVDEISRIVPDGARGEAMGWHGSAMTTGSALGAPIAGIAIDRYGFGGGFVIVSVIGIAVAAAVFIALTTRRRSRPTLDGGVQSMWKISSTGDHHSPGSAVSTGS
jgi:predicted MFS family arabinose efflux permease